ncbi:MAG: LytTR family transcriptional regulator [Ruminococcus sp.]|nr:LytTR family transcriptional regulator [Ruminococcus sp.]
MKMTLSVSEQRYKEIFDELTELGVEIEDDADLLLTERRLSQGFLSVRNDKGGRVSIKTEDIIFIESFGNEMLVHTVSECFKAYDRLYKLESLLDGGFLRVSNCALVNKKEIKNIRPALSRKFVLTLSDGTLVDVTRSYYDSFRRAFGI